MNNPAFLLKLLAGFIGILVVLQVVSLFRRTRDPDVRDVKEQMEKIDAINAMLQHNLDSLNARSAAIDMVLSKQLQSYQVQVEDFKRLISTVAANSEDIRMRVKAMNTLLKASGAPDKIPTLDELKKGN